MRRIECVAERGAEALAGGRAPCIVVVTPNHLVTNPRVIKEADALADAGFRVHVVFAQRAAGKSREQDTELLSGREWSSTAVRAARTKGEFVRYATSTTRRHLYEYVPRALWTKSLAAERASGRMFPLLARAAIRAEGDLYIAHYAEGLAAAGIAASRTGALLGFDAEDFHTGEPNGAIEVSRTDFLQARYLPRCRWLTAASQGIGRALAERYGVAEPQTIYNVFPLADRLELDGERRDRRSDNLSLYWFSQVIGLDRGIQDVIRAAGRMGGVVEIHLRGLLQPNVREALLNLARECGVADEIFFHAPVAPSELLSRAAEHDIGLALEQPTTINHMLCVPNKLFHYLLAGLAVAATDVPGQTSVLAEHSDAAALYRPGDVEGLASALERWRCNRPLLENAKAAALRSAQERWNWERESQKLVSHARALLLPDRMALTERPTRAGISA